MGDAKIKQNLLKNAGTFRSCTWVAAPCCLKTDNSVTVFEKRGKTVCTILSEFIPVRAFAVYYITDNCNHDNNNSDNNEDINFKDLA